MVIQNSGGHPCMVLWVSFWWWSSFDHNEHKFLEVELLDQSESIFFTSMGFLIYTENSDKFVLWQFLKIFYLEKNANLHIKLQKWKCHPNTCIHPYPPIVKLLFTPFALLCTPSPTSLYTRETDRGPYFSWTTLE